MLQKPLEASHGDWLISAGTRAHSKQHKASWRELPAKSSQTSHWDGRGCFGFVLFCFIEGELTHNVGLISAVQQRDSATHIPASIPTWVIPEHWVRSPVLPAGAPRHPFHTQGVLCLWDGRSLPPPFRSRKAGAIHEDLRRALAWSLG